MVSAWYSVRRALRDAIVSRRSLRHSAGTKVSSACNWASSATGVTDPVTFYNPSIGPAGITFYEGDRYPGWKGSLFLSAMVGQKLIRLDIKNDQIAGQETIFADYGRVRDVLTGPDGLLYVLLQNRNGDPKGGSIIRLAPAK